MKKCILSFLLLFCMALSADVILSPLFSDHAVLARKSVVPIWGKAAPGEYVEVSIAGVTGRTRADIRGRWIVRLDLSKCGNGPFELKANDAVSRDVLIGEVFLASGQSNMTLQFRNVYDWSEIARQSADNGFRYFDVGRKWVPTPQEEVTGKWEIVSPENVWRFSALAYLFGRELRRELGSPVGIVHASLGGTPIDGWMSVESIAPFADRLAVKERGEAHMAAYPDKEAAFLRDYPLWEKNLGRDLPRPATVPQVTWGRRKVGGQLSNTGGAVWIRFKTDLSEAEVRQGISVVIGRPDCIIDIYINGRRVSGNNLGSVARKKVFFAMPRQGANVGENEIAIRFFSSGNEVKVPMPFNFGKKIFREGEGEWEVYVEKEFPALTAEQQSSRPVFNEAFLSMERYPCQLYNGMIHPLHPLALTGVIWYQGEHEANRPDFYRQAFPRLISDWRQRFEDPELPFFFCQLAAFHAKTNDPANAGWAAQRDAQGSVLNLRNTAMVIITDAGESDDIHPVDKHTPARRMAACALAMIYKRDVQYRAPEARCARGEQNGVVAVYFDCFNTSLTARPVATEYYVRRSAGRKAPLVRNSPEAQVENVALCGSDGRWFWAKDARIIGNMLIASSPEVPRPVKIRYNWNSNPSGNLFGENGFPVNQFELDVQR